MKSIALSGISRKHQLGRAGKAGKTKHERQQSWLRVLDRYIMILSVAASPR